MYPTLSQKFDIWPVLVRVDYSPHHVDLAALRSGKYVELVNLVPWKVRLSFFLQFSDWDSSPLGCASKFVNKKERKRS